MVSQSTRKGVDSGVISPIMCVISLAGYTSYACFHLSPVQRHAKSPLVPQNNLEVDINPTLPVVTLPKLDTVIQFKVQ